MLSSYTGGKLLQSELKRSFLRINKLKLTPKRLKGHEGLVDSVRMKTDLVVSSGADRQIRLWSTWSGECCRVIKIQFGVQVLVEGCFPMVHISGNRMVSVTAYVLDLHNSQSDYPIH